MLEKLHRQFVVVMVVAVGLVLMAVMGTSVYSSYRNQQRMVHDALDRCAWLGPYATRAWSADEGERPPSMVTATVSVESDGTVMARAAATSSISEQTIASVITKALSSDDEYGHDASDRISWKRAANADGTYTIAMVETSAMDAALRSQVVSSLVIVVAAMLVLFVVSWFLTRWMLRPVVEAWEAQRRFVADASHELKTPLTVILANSQILQDDSTLTDETRRWVDSTAEEASQMSSLVNDLLTLARADERAAQGSGAAETTEDVDLSDVVEQATLEFDAVAFERGCSVEEDVQPGVHVQGRRPELVRLTKILVDNATKYAQRGTPVRVELRREGGKAHLSVNNQGTPVPAEDLPHLFDRFYRSDKARARQTGGFGLGLAIARSIAESHGGTIGVTSDEQSGTTFTVTL